MEAWFFLYEVKWIFFSFKVGGCYCTKKKNSMVTMGKNCGWIVPELDSLHLQGSDQTFPSASSANLAPKIHLRETLC